MSVTKYLAYDLPETAMSVAYYLAYDLLETVYIYIYIYRRGRKKLTRPIKDSKRPQPHHLSLKELNIFCKKTW